MKKLYFVRHGQSEMNLAELASGTTETPLTAEGRKQAQAAGKHAKNLEIDCIVCSPLGRALETEKIIAKSIGYPESKIHVNNLFIERPLPSSPRRSPTITSTDIYARRIQEHYL